MSARLNYRDADPETYKAVLALEMHIRQAGLEPGLLHLVKLRASQINGCAFCVDMHSREALADGETPRRLHLLVTWRESGLFTAREQAALAWTEALTRIADAPPGDADYAALRAEFSEREMMTLSTAIGVINIWNRLSVGFAVAPPKEMAAA